MLDMMVLVIYLAMRKKGNGVGIVQMDLHLLNVRSARFIYAWIKIVIVTLPIILNSAAWYITTNNGELQYIPDLALKEQDT
jgi:hypothetical protein